LFEKQLEDEQEKLRKERTENEEVDFAKWKPQFVIEEAGTDALNELQVKQRDLEIITQIKKNKVSVLEDLAAEFKIKTAELIEKIQDFEGKGEMNGVRDDRGKYIYITKEEMENVANFIKRRGRVHIEDIVRESNRLIDLTSES